MLSILDELLDIFAWPAVIIFVAWALDSGISWFTHASPLCA